MTEAPDQSLPSVIEAGLPATVIERLREGAHHARSTMAAETIRAMKRSFEAFSAWCTQRHYVALPAEAAIVTAYVDELATSGRKAAGIKQVVWVIGAMHRLGRLPNPTKAEMVRQALKRISRELGTRRQQAAPVRAYEVRRILETAGTRPIDKRDIALLLVMRDLLARRSEVVALDAEDISYDQDGSGIALIRRSKTDQDGQGAELYLSPNAVAHLRRWLTTAGITEGPIFRAVDKGDRLGERLQPAEVARIIKRLGLRAGLAVERISGHSCRVGMAQDLVAFGADVAGLMQAGRWKSVQMPARYSSRLTAKHGVVAQMQDKLNPVGG